MSLCCPRRLVALTLTLLLVASLVPAMAQDQRIAEIVVTGNQNINRDAIVNASELKPGDTLSSDALARAKKAVGDLGYFSNVAINTETTAEGVKVKIDVVENAVIKEIKVIGNEPIAKQKVLDAMRLKPGQVLNTRALEQDVDSIQRLYQDEGYIAIVTEDIQIDRDGVLTIPILVHKVEAIDVTGNKKTQEYVFLREMKLKPGDYFNTKVLKEDIARIWNLDILEDMQAPKPEPGSDIGKVRVLIPITEKKTGQVSVGLGYSSQQKLVGRAELNETNFRGTGQGLNLLWETSSTEGVDGNNSYELGYFLPWIDKNHTSLSLSAYDKLLYRFSSSALGGGSYISSDSTDYTERHTGGSGTISRPFGDFTRAYLTLKGESVNTPGFGLAYTALNDLTTPTVFNTAPITETGDVRSIGMRLVDNRRDFDVDPAAGRYNSVNLELGQADGDTYTVKSRDGIDPITNQPAEEWYTEAVPRKGAFQKIQFDVRQYFSKGGKKNNPRDKRRTVAVRAMAGVGGGTLPFFEQFFVGGAESLRGYREDRFWGDKMALLSAEYRVPVANSLTGVLFVDYGDAWGSDRQLEDNELVQHQSFKGHVGVGPGLRVATPIGNLRLDYGLGSEGARTHFSIGHAF